MAYNFREILILFLILKISALYNPINPEEDNTIHDLFNQLNKKSLTLYYCRSWTNGILWRIPPPIECPLLSSTNDSKVVDVTFWWRDITKQALDSQEYFKETTTVRKSYFFFGSYSNERHTERKPMTEAECRHMVNQQISPEGQVVNRILDGLFGTQLDTDIDYSWPHTLTKSTTNYFYINLQISINDLDDSIITTSKITEECKFQRGYCPTDEGCLIWKPSQYQPCRLKMGQQTKCLLTGKRMSCPQINIAITEITTLHVCDSSIGYSQQGIMFSQDTQGEIHPNIATSAEIIGRTEGYRKMRRKRAMNPKTLPSSKLDSQLNGEFQFLYETLKTNISFNIQMLHREICRSHQLELELISALAEGGQASLMVRTLLKDRRYRAKISGDALAVYKCQEIFEYMLLPSTNCTREWPLVFITNHDQKYGWLSPLSHEILDEPTYIECPAPVFILDLGEKTVHLTNRSLITHLEILPSPAEGLSLKEIPDISFSTPGVYSIEELTGQDTLLGLMKQLQKRSRVEQVVSDRLNGKPLNESLCFGFTIFSGQRGYSE